ncbi:hypothetical protein Nizo2264_1113 [Lactiplantibacillus plantarum]|nr:hypothetical protein Nizo2264_1113 [Lactiplantibacillus plantarum]
MKKQSVAPAKHFTMYKFVQKNTQNLLKIDNDKETLLLR